MPMEPRCFRYQSGEEIRKGERIRYHEDPGEVEFVANRLTGDPESDWYVTEHGGGVGLLVPKSFGRVFLTSTDDDEDLEFISRTG
jgi:hypothetical protein